MLNKILIYVYDMIIVKDRFVMRNISYDKLIYNKNSYINFNIFECFWKYNFELMWNKNKIYDIIWNYFFWLKCKIIY